MICDICGNNSGKICSVTRSYGSGEKLIIIENIPVVSCSQRIKIHRDGFTHE